MVVKVKIPKLQRIGFHHDEPELFVTTQWTRNVEKSLLFLFFRWILAGFFIGIVAYSWTKSISRGTFGFWFIYLTNWGILFCMISTTLAAFLTTFYHFNWTKLDSQSASYKLYWFLSNVSTVLAFVITVVYWSILFDGTTSTIDVLVHGGNSAGMLIELMVVRHPMHFFHFVYSIGIGLIYLAFTIIYYFAGGVDFVGRNYIYNVLYWGNAGKAASVAVGVAVLSLFLHVFVCILQKMRHRIHKKIFKKTSLEINVQATV